MTPRPRHLRTALSAFLAAALLVACEPDAPDLPEAPPAQDGTIEQPDPEAVDQPAIDPEEIEAD